MLKLAQQEKLLLFLNGRHAGQRCYCGAKTEEKAAPRVAPFHKSQGCSCNPFNSCNGPGLGSTTRHPIDFRPNGSLHLYRHPASGCCCCLQTAGVETYTVVCPKRLHVFSCAGMAVCPLASAPQPSSLCSAPSPVYPSSPACCNHQRLLACRCYSPSFHAGETKRSEVVGDADPPCPVLKREHSPSPPPLSPIPSDVSKCDEKPPSLLPHGQGDEDGLNPSRQEADMHADAEAEGERLPPEPNPSVTILQDVMNRFSEKLETIRPAEKDPPLDPALTCASENDPPASPSTSQKVHFHADAHLTEIITTVLHTGSASDYNLSELFNHHDSKDPKSPNTRSRRRQEVLAAMATPTHDASSRRHTLQIKRELAMLDQSRTRRKAPSSKRAKSKDETGGVALSNTPSDTDGPKQETDTDTEPEHARHNGSGDGWPKPAVAECGEDGIKEEIKAVVITEEVLHGKAEKEEMSISPEETADAGAEDQTPGLEVQGTCANEGVEEDACREATSAAAARPRRVGRPRHTDLGHPAGSDGIHRESPPGPDGGGGGSTQGKDGNPGDARRSGRKIVPPQRFSSFVTESRKMFFVACFSENIFTKGVEKEAESEGTGRKSTPDSPLAPSAQHPPASRSPPVEDKSPTEGRADGPGCTGRGADILGRLRATSKRMQDFKFTSESAAGVCETTASSTSVHMSSHCPLQFTSPVKLMFVSPVKDEDGLRYSLTAAGPGCSGQEEPFDPCEESSWSGTSQSAPTQINSPSPKSASPFRPVSQPFRATPSPPTRSSPLSPSKSSSSPAKHASAALKSASSPRKSPSSPAKSLRSSPKISPRRSGEGTPTKLVGEATPFVESAPQKRRPGRPKKLRPQPELKVKRPIGRPRKQRDADSVAGARKSNGDSRKPSDGEDNANKNLKITVVYGRSRRNKRTVCEGFDQLQTEFRDACQAAGFKGDLGLLMHSSRPGSGPESSTEPPEILRLVSPPKESSTQSSSNIKCPKRDDSAPIRKPGRPAKIKISGISVTVTTVSPRQRKIQLRKNARQAPEAPPPRTKVRSPGFKAAKGPLTIHSKAASDAAPADAGAETRDRGKDGVAVRHSARVRKPSIHFLHAVATSAYRSYSRSNALLRRSKQLLLNKVSNERKQASSAEVRGEERICGPRRQNIAEELGRMAGVSVDSIFGPRQALKWWAASAEETAVNRELARRIRLISDTWVSDMVANQGKDAALSPKRSGAGDRKGRAPSAVRALFDCSPDKPRSCSMQQLCSWFMKTTETRSLAIVRKTSSRNPYELMHFPRSGADKRTCHSPQAERLRKHVKKFAKIVPKSPVEHRLMRRRARTPSQRSTRDFKRELFPPEATEDRRGAQRGRNSVFSIYRATLRRARTRFLKRRDRRTWPRSHRDALALHPKRKAARAPKPHRRLEQRGGGGVEDGRRADVPKQQNLCCKAWSPESLKECRVFLRKINSPDSESAEEEWDSCTVTLDDGSPSAHLAAGRRRRELEEVVKAERAARKRSTDRPSPRKRAGSVAGTAPEVPAKRQKGRKKLLGAVSTEPPRPPSAKLLRQSRMKGLTGPRWCDFVFEK